MVSIYVEEVCGRGVVLRSNGNPAGAGEIGSNTRGRESKILQRSSVKDAQENINGE